MPKEKKTTKKNVVTHDVASALDRTQVSDRKTVFLLSATASSLCQNASELAINGSTIHRTRIKARNTIAAAIKQSFDPQTPLTVHWDGKLLPELTSNDKVGQ